VKLANGCKGKILNLPATHKAFSRYRLSDLFSSHEARWASLDVEGQVYTQVSAREMGRPIRGLDKMKISCLQGPENHVQS
jgi:hypothetical protein